MTDRFDPRFDPRFQPGYEPGADRPGPDRPGPDHPGSDRPGSGESKPQEAPRTGPASHHRESVAPIVAGFIDGTPALEAEPDEPVVPPEPNPLERILLVIGAALIVGGIAAAFWANSLNYQYTSFGTGLSWQQLLQSAAWSLSAPMVTVGLAIGVGILFRRAIAWKPPE